MSSDDAESQVSIAELLDEVDVDATEEDDLAGDLEDAMAHLDELDTDALDDTEGALADVAQAHNSDLTNLASAVQGLTEVVQVLLKQRREDLLAPDDTDTDDELNSDDELRSFQ